MKLSKLLHHVYENGTRIVVEGEHSEIAETTIKDNYTLLFTLRELLKNADFQPTRVTIGENSAKWKNPSLFLVKDIAEQENKVVYGWRNENNFVISISDAKVYRDGVRMLDTMSWETELDGDVIIV